MEGRRCWRGRLKRSPPRIKISGPRPLATMERIPPPEPRRGEDALREAAVPEAHGTGLRPSGRGTPNLDRRAKRLYRARHTRHRTSGLNPSG